MHLKVKSTALQFSSFIPKMHSVVARAEVFSPFSQVIKKALHKKYASF